MEIIIDINKIDDPAKREWLLNSLKWMNIPYQTEGETSIATLSEEEIIPKPITVKTDATKWW